MTHMLKGYLNITLIGIAKCDSASRTTSQKIVSGLILGTFCCAELLYCA